jgi:3-oxoacyl-[acyl-carrier-protein] synthase-1
MTQATIVATSVLCAAGRGADQVWASVRAGAAHITNSLVMNRQFEAIRMGLIPENALEPVSPELESLSLPSRPFRMLRLAAPTLRALPKAIRSEPIALYLGLPELLPDEAAWLAAFPAQLARFAGCEIDTAASRTLPSGRASVFSAIEQALAAFEADPSKSIVVGGVDTFLDLRLLATLDADQRILGSSAKDAFIPGEGAAFLVLASEANARASTSASINIAGAISCLDAGHRYGSDPARGEGLAQAIEALRLSLGDRAQPVATIFAGLNGESFDAKLWGVAHVRHSDFFTTSTKFEHPADCFGDTGAATGALLVALAKVALSSGQRAGPALAWAASDQESRGCALLSANIS